MAVVVGLVTDLNGRLNIKCHRLLTLEGEREEREGAITLNTLSLHINMHTCMCVQHMYTCAPPTIIRKDSAYTGPADQ